MEKRGEFNPMATSVNPTTQGVEPPEVEEKVLDVQRTTCCVVGGGPGGAVLALLLAHKGIDVTLLEAHDDFDRDFRGDTLHPSVLEIMEELGLAEKLLALPHTKISSFPLQTASGPFVPLDFRRLRTQFPYIAVMPQTRFLEFVTAEAKQYRNFRLVMGARARELVEEGGAVRGVRYKSDEGTHEVRALLTVGADGRFSRLRKLAGLAAQEASPPIDVLWFRIPRRPEEPQEIIGRFAGGRVGVLLDRGEQWQCAYVIPKGTYRDIKTAGLEELRRSLANVVPEVADRVGHLKEWKQISLLSVEADRLRKWHRPGLLMIGDAAHTMSPVAGVGINYAIQDAVVAANVLAGPLREGQVTERGLAKVQRRRELPTRLI
jgi:2-polyprenyl-6-methoxyphenol hydroxylase-like FAD-dependent oxidoreductase